MNKPSDMPSSFCELWGVPYQAFTENNPKLELTQTAYHMVTENISKFCETPHWIPSLILQTIEHRFILLSNDSSIPPPLSHNYKCIIIHCAMGWSLVMDAQHLLKDLCHSLRLFVCDIRPSTGSRFDVPLKRPHTHQTSQSETESGTRGTLTKFIIRLCCHSHNSTNHCLSE